MYCRHFLHAAAHCRFWTLLAGAKHHKDQFLPDIVDLARAKLICDSNITHIVGCVIGDDFADRGHLVWSPHETWCFGFVHGLPVSVVKISVSDIGLI